MADASLADFVDIEFHIIKYGLSDINFLYAAYERRDTEEKAVVS